MSSCPYVRLLSLQFVFHFYSLAEGSLILASSLQRSSGDPIKYIYFKSVSHTLQRKLISQF